jgi:enoyl-CoA hydratase
MTPGSPRLDVQGAVATLTLQRPDQANRLSADDLESLTTLLAEVNNRPEVLVLQLRATGRYFCSGYDIGSIGGARKVDFGAMVDAVEQARPVTIAVLQGGVYGGATDLVLACDFRIGARGIDMFMPAARLGLHYYQSGLERYVTRLGLNAAKRLFLTAEKIDADEMKAIGYLTHLADADRLDEAADELTRSCCSMAPIPLLAMKRHLDRIARGTLDVAQLQIDMRRAYESSDLREGQAAWAERRAPRFQGH